MADTKISDLPAATTPLVGTEQLPLVQSGQTRRVSASALGAVPGGSGTQLQFRNGTSFGGVTGTSWDGVNLLLSINFDGIGGVIGTPPSQSLRIRNDAPSTAGQNQFSPSLNFAGSGWRTNSPAGSRPVEWQVFVQTRTGTTNPSQALVFRPSVNGVAQHGIAFSTGGVDGYQNGVYITGLDGSTFSSHDVNASVSFTGFGPNNATNLFCAYANGGVRFTFANNFVCVNNGVPLTFSPDTSNAIGDLHVYRDAADTLAVRRGTNAQRLRVYNTESGSLANFERLNIEWDSDFAYIRPTAGGTGTLRPLIVRHPPVTVASLPSASSVGAGARCFVSDATSTTFGSVVAGGGSNSVPVYSDGANWRIG